MMKKRLMSNMENMNDFIKQPVVYHGSKRGLDGPIKIGYVSDDNQILSRSKTDFGLGFYMGTNYKQCLGIVNNEAKPYMYEITIPKDLITNENTLVLEKEDWTYFVLYNRGYLEDIKGTDFYNYYAHLADNKQYIIGAIADDTFNACIDDFNKNNITDYTFMQLIDCFNLGVQVVAKSQEACDKLQILSENAITKDERKKSLESTRLNHNERNDYYDEKRNEYNIERKGKYLSEIFKEARENSIIYNKDNIDTNKFKNIKFPNTIHDKGDDEIELYN